MPHRSTTRRRTDFDLIKRLFTTIRIRCPRFVSRPPLSLNLQLIEIFHLRAVTARSPRDEGSHERLALHFERDRRYLLIIAYLADSKTAGSLIHPLCRGYLLLPFAVFQLLDLSSPALLAAFPPFLLPPCFPLYNLQVPQRNFESLSFSDGRKGRRDGRRVRKLAVNSGKNESREINDAHARKRSLARQRTHFTSYETCDLREKEPTEVKRTGPGVLAPKLEMYRTRDFPISKWSGMGNDDRARARARCVTQGRTNK